MGMTNAKGMYRGNSSIAKALQNGDIPMEVARWTIHKQIPRSTMAALLNKLPPADASYTLRVTGDNDKPVLDYIFKKGKLVHINHYVYKDKKGTQGSGQH